MHTAAVILASDHAGFSLRQDLASFLRAAGRQVEDIGPATEESTDYPVYACDLCRRVLELNAFGVLVCGTGLGMSMAANRFPGIRAALCSNESMARLARRHNDANVLCLGSRILGADLALAILEAFLAEGFESGRHQRRIDLIESLAS